ncbi:unnamed protein product [Rotaria sordida]|uniref:Uncharacterized protein n=1 Tax=Rotaria sordida TaxID=392033 RepID=A0A819PQ91_9BILA|nr:unnamed protein product [Rotaria sordida]
MMRSYFYRTNGVQHWQLQRDRHSGSYVKGTIKHDFGGQWQAAANHLHHVAKAGGSIIQIEFCTSSAHQGGIDFKIYYDDVQAARKFYDQVQSMDFLKQETMFPGLIYNETPPPPNNAAQ